MLTDLKRLGELCRSGQVSIPDMVVVALDANCKGINEGRDHIQRSVGEGLRNLVVPAIAEPHIERWFLLDGRAFKKVLGRGCETPQEKCEKDRYKKRLVDEILKAGVDPPLGGIEYAEDLAYEMDLKSAGIIDPAFRDFIEDLRSRLSAQRKS